MLCGYFSNEMSNGPITVPNFSVMEVSTSTTSLAMLYNIRGEIKQWKPKMQLSKKLCDKLTPYESWLAHKKDKRSHSKRVIKGLKKSTVRGNYLEFYDMLAAEFDAEAELEAIAYEQDIIELNAEMLMSNHEEPVVLVHVSIGSFDGAHSPRVSMGNGVSFCCMV